MKRFFTHPYAKYVMGADIGFGWLERLSLLDLHAALPNRWHTHEEIEVICCLKGELAYELQGHPFVTIPAGCCLVVPARQAHRNAEGIDAPACRLSFFIRPRLPRCSRFTVFTAAEFASLRAALLRRSLRPLAISANARASLAGLAAIAAKGGATTLQEKLGLRARTFATLLDLSAPPNAVPSPSPRPHLIEEAVKWLEAHAAEKVALPQLVAYMGYGRSRLYALFRSHTGLSPIDWLIRHRIATAKTLLREERLSVRDVAFRTGFPDAAFFSRVFKRRTGYTPLAYRDKSRKSAGA